MDSRPRYIMIGGFLGAGKTTAINRFARHLSDQGLKVGLITNDQGAGLVDSALGRSAQFPVEEIAGGCFCCRFNSLVDAARRLTDETRPDVFLAEPVGSCTDLVATVSLPLQKIYGDRFAVAPLTVVLDPVRARRLFGLDEGRRFSTNVQYIYRKQLEEAEIIVVNKADLLDESELDALEARLASEFPEARRFRLSSRTGEGMVPWFDEAMDREIDVPRFLDIDYDRYGDGEALLGWLNFTVAASGSDTEFDGNEVLSALAQAVGEALRSHGSEVAHLKMTLSPALDPVEVAAINLVRGDATPELSHRLPDPVDEAEILLNLRAEADPDVLESSVRDALSAVLSGRFRLAYDVTHAEHFRPGRPTPTHRLTV